MVLLTHLGVGLEKTLPESKKFDHSQLNNGFEGHSDVLSVSAINLGSRVWNITSRSLASRGYNRGQGIPG